LQDKLRSLNLQYYKYLCHELTSYETMNTSNPLLLNISEGYITSRVKIMIVGKETFAWHGTFNLGLADVIVDELMDLYRVFLRNTVHEGTPFWSFSRKLDKALNPNNKDTSVAWSNLIKVDQGRGRPSKDIEKIVCGFPILEKEIEILHPDLVIFLTGYGYDGRLQQTFPGVEYEAVEGATDKELVRLKHLNLPLNSFRTYHPKHLRMSGLENKVLHQLINLMDRNSVKLSMERIIE
jgi:hypothetical protein